MAPGMRGPASPERPPQPLAAAAAASPKFLIGASIPRSGHHYVQALLERYYGDALFYCEFYNPPNCCKAIPCTRRGAHSLVYQKSHDREREVPLDLDALYVVQYRDPVPEALSDRELDLRDSLARRAKSYRLTPSGYTWWLAAKAVYYRRFHDKWLGRRLSNAVYLDYDELLRDPAAAVAPIIEWGSGRVDRARLDEAVEAGRSRRGRTAQPFRPRVVERSPHFDRDLLGAFEAFVVERCPGFGFARRLDGSYRDHPIYGAILLLDEGEPLPGSQFDRLGYAALYAPEQPEIRLRAAEQCLRADEPGAAIEILKRAVAADPLFAPAYRLLVKATAAAGRPLPPAALTADAVLACVDQPETLPQIAAACRDNDLLATTIMAAATATVLIPDAPEPHHELAALLLREGRVEQALAHAEAALARAPDDAPTRDLAARIREQFGAIRDGVGPVVKAAKAAARAAGDAPVEPAVEKLVTAAYRAVLGRLPKPQRMRASCGLFDGAPIEEGLERLLTALLRSKEFRDRRRRAAAPANAGPREARAPASPGG